MDLLRPRGGWRGDTRTRRPLRARQAPRPVLAKRVSTARCAGRAPTPDWSSTPITVEVGVGKTVAVCAVLAGLDQTRVRHPGDLPGQPRRRRARHQRRRRDYLGQAPQFHTAMAHPAGHRCVRTMTNLVELAGIEPGEQSRAPSGRRSGAFSKVS